MVLNNILLKKNVFGKINLFESQKCNLTKKSSESKNYAQFKKSLVFACLLFCFTNVFALEVPALKGRVNDYANVISKNDEQQINEYLSNVENQTGIQIAVLTVPSLKGEDIAAFGVKVAEKWKLGQKGEDNGALLLVAMEERELRIEVGYGLEGLLTDAKCGLIIRNVIIPEFKDGDYSGGIKKGVMNIGGIACGDTEIVDKKVLNEEDEDSGAGLVFMIIWMIFIFVIITSKGGIFKWIFLSNVSRNVGRNINAGNHSSIHKSGGFGGGNFGGFSGGGGHFGGGGASGHW